MDHDWRRDGATAGSTRCTCSARGSSSTRRSGGTRGTTRGHGSATGAFLLHVPAIAARLSGAAAAGRRGGDAVKKGQRAAKVA